MFPALASADERCAPTERAYQIMVFEGMERIDAGVSGGTLVELFADKEGHWFLLQTGGEETTTCVVFEGEAWGQFSLPELVDPAEKDS